MNKPLFGDENAKWKRIAYYSVVVVEAMAIATTVLFCAIFTVFGHWQHAWSAACIILWTIPIGFLVYLDRTTYMETKYRIVLYILAVVILVQCACAFSYIFGSSMDYCSWAGGMFIDGKCQTKFKCYSVEGSCAAWVNGSPQCGYWNSSGRSCYGFY